MRTNLWLWCVVLGLCGGECAAGANDTQTPVIDEIGVTNVTGATADITWITDTPSTSEVDYGPTPSYGDTVVQPELVTAHAVRLTGLLGVTTYHFRVRSIDAEGNTAVSGDQTFTTLSPGPSVVTVDGRQLLVSRRNLDGTLEPPTAYVIRGMDWSPASQDTDTHPRDPNNVRVRRPEFGRWYLTDLPLIQAMNVNTARTFMDLGLPGDPGVTVPGPEILDALYRNGIMVIMTVDDAINNLTRVELAVNFYKDHPAVLMWLLGSEWNINRYFGVASSVPDAADRTQRAAALIKTLDTNHPAVSSYGEIDINQDGMRLADTERYVNTVCPSIDVWSLNIYRGDNFGTLFQQWGSMTNKPMFLGEFGADAYHVIADPPGVDELEQARWNLSLWRDILRNLSARDSAQVAIGGAVFEWNDEWWKVPPPGSPFSQEPGGWLSGGFPDGMGNEEYFGTVDIDRTTRQVYNTLQEAFDPAYNPAPQPVMFRAASRGDCGYAEFYKSATRLYRGVGCALRMGRGFNVATIDRNTGELLEPVRSFDTWYTRGTGEDMTQFLDYLESLPNGTFLMIAVADEAGLNPDRSCTRFNYPWVARAIEVLTALGSTEIERYCFWDSWAMVAIKGEGTALSEQRRQGTEASAQAPLDLP